MLTGLPRRCDYRIYPSLLDKFQDLCDYREVAAQDWNRVSESAHARGEHRDKEVGDYKLSEDEMHAKLEAELIDSINRCPHEPREAADKGTAFNEVVDCLIENRNSDKVGLRRHYTLQETGHPGPLDGVEASLNGFTFVFDLELCRRTASTFRGSLCQYLAEATMETSCGTVELYGFIDEWVGDRIYDIKTTSRYEFGKFERRWQRHLYPWCVVESGMAQSIREFTYWVVEWAYQRPYEPLTAKGIYPETYTYDHTESGLLLRSHVERFISWLEYRRDFITDRRIFGGENPKDYHGVAVDIEKLTQTQFTTAI